MLTNISNHWILASNKYNCGWRTTVYKCFCLIPVSSLAKCIQVVYQECSVIFLNSYFVECMYLAFKFPSKPSAYLLPKIATFRWSEHKNIPRSDNEKLSIFGFFVETIGLAKLLYFSVFQGIIFCRSKKDSSACPENILIISSLGYLVY